MVPKRSVMINEWSNKCSICSLDSCCISSLLLLCFSQKTLSRICFSTACQHSSCLAGAKDTLLRGIWPWKGLFVMFIVRKSITLSRVGFFLQPKQIYIEQHLYVLSSSCSWVETMEQKPQTVEEGQAQSKAARLTCYFCFSPPSGIQLL